MNTTAWVLISFISLLAGYDVFAAWKWGYHGTISFDVLTASKSHPIIPFAIGVVAGHLFWQQ